MNKYASWLLVLLLGGALSPLAVSSENHQNDGSEHTGEHSDKGHSDAEQGHDEVGHEDHDGEEGEGGVTLTPEQLEIGRAHV